MNLYLIERNAYDWDQYVSGVVAAPSPRAARKAAAAEMGSEHWSGTPRKEWLDPCKSACRKIGTYTGSRRVAHVVHYHFHAG